jgi:hypothetical protein
MRKSLLVTALLVILSRGEAWAQHWSSSASAAGGYGSIAGYPDEYALRPLRLPTGLVQLKVPVVINLSKDHVASPVTIPFEIRLGLTHELELRLFHPGNGLCISGKSKGCGKVYNDLALGMLYSVMREQGVELALLGAVEVTSFSSPAMVRLDAGMAFKYIHAPFSIATWPYVGIGLNHRDQNGDSINIPAEFAYQLAGPTALFFESGLFGGAHNFGDSWVMPLGVGIDYLLQHSFDIGAEFKFTSLIGNGSTDGRLILVYVALRG